MYSRGNPDQKDQKDKNTADDPTEVQKWTQSRVTPEHFTIVDLSKEIKYC